MDLRGSSTALDTVLFVVLVGVAVAALLGATPGESDGAERVADETADVLATSTAEVSYARWGRVAVDGDGSVDVDRRASGTYAELLAAGVVATALPGGTTDLDDAAANASRRALPTGDASVQVRATWEPHPGSDLGRTLTVGERPPRDADLSVARLTVPSGMPNASARLRSDAASFRHVAAVVAKHVVAGMFPPERMRAAMASEGPDRAVAASRYRGARDRYGARVEEPLEGGDVETANARVAEALQRDIHRELAREFDSPGEAARAVSVDRVRIVVRAWSS